MLKVSEKEAVHAEAVSTMLDIKANLRENATRIIDLFHQLDKNSDGSVSAGELKSRLPEIGFAGHDDKAIGDLFATLDLDGSGSIGYRELHKMLRPGQTSPSTGPSAGRRWRSRRRKNPIPLREGPASLRNRVAVLTSYK